jgi:hypothetical protein
MKKNTIKITKQEMWDLGFEKIVEGDKEYVDVAPFLLDSESELVRNYERYVAMKKKEYFAQKKKKKKGKHS